MDCSALQYGMAFVPGGQIKRSLLWSAALLEIYSQTVKLNTSSVIILGSSIATYLRYVIANTFNSS